MALRLKRGELRRLELYLFAGGFTRHDPRPGYQLTHEPVIDRQRILDNFGPLGVGEFRHLVDKLRLAFGQNRLDSGATHKSSFSPQLCIRNEQASNNVKAGHASARGAALERGDE